MTATLDHHTVPPPAPAGPVRPPRTRQRLVMRSVVVLSAVAFVWAWRYVEMSFGGIVEGAGDVRALLGRMLPPSFQDLDQAIDLAFETLWMAVLGTLLALVLSVPLAFAAARNTTPHPMVMRAARAIITGARAIPDLIFAAMFVRALGIGVLPGILAIGVHSVGMVGKLFADAIEQTERLPREAAVSTGATRMQEIVTSVIPQAMPSFIATTLYRLDINLRSSTVLGFVGAGGIGFLFQKTLRSLEYDRALGVALVVFAFITVMEIVSSVVRSTLLGKERSFVGARAPKWSLGALVVSRLGRLRRGGSVGASTAGVRAFDRVRVCPPFVGELRSKTLYGVVALALVLYAWWAVRVSPFTVFTSFDDIWRFGLRLFPPDFTTAREAIITGMVESLAVAIVATVLGSLLSLPLGLLAARNVTVNRVVRMMARLTLVGLRGLPDLIVAVIFIAAIGLGPVPGTLALVLGTTGFFAKLIADSVEEIDPNPREAVFSTGANRVQETATSVLPQAMPALVGHLLYVLDINLRTSTILGIVGGGGIGFVLFNSLRVLELQTTGAVVLSIFVVVYLIELLAGWVRSQIL
jgi:phosphonate transport system permease protein